MKVNSIQLSCLLMATLCAVALAAPASDELNQNDAVLPSRGETIKIQNPDGSIQKTITGIITNFFGRFSSIFGIPSPPQEDFVPSRDLTPNDDTKPREDKIQPDESATTSDQVSPLQKHDQESKSGQGSRDQDEHNSPPTGPKPIKPTTPETLNDDDHVTSNSTNSSDKRPVNVKSDEPNYNDLNENEIFQDLENYETA